MDPYGTPRAAPKSATSELEVSNSEGLRLDLIPSFSPLFRLLSAKGGRRVGSASLTPASVRGVSRPRPASTLLPTSLSTPMGSAGTGTTGKGSSFFRLSFILLEGFHVLSVDAT